MASRHPLSRRSFLQTVAIVAGTSVTGLSLTACNSGDAADPLIGVAFRHGIASGDPLPDAVILWTRVTPVEATDVQFEVAVEVATDPGFTSILASGTATTSAAVDYTVKFDISGLSAATRYYYRFIAEGVTSNTGTTRTLPVGAVSEATLAVVSCSNFPAGYFHVYAELAARDDLDALLHLGDYIYEYPADGYASADAEALGRVSVPATELLTLADYRARYAQYHEDESLQAAHAGLAFILVWDDHEIANDAWREGAENHDAASEGDYAQRRAAAIQAWYEWLPVREPTAGSARGSIFRRFDFGDLLSLHMLDTRHLGRDQGLSYANYLDAQGNFDSATFTADLTASERQLLGETQTEWLRAQLGSSTATWQVLGQQVLMGRMNIPAPLLLPDPLSPQISFSAYGQVLAKAQSAPQTLSPEEQAILAAPSIAYNLDAWDGYFVQRETILGTALALDKNLVVLSGDTHNAWASDLQDIQGVQVGVEFATASVSSPGLEAILTQENPAVLAAGLTQLIAPLKYCNTADRGYMTVNFSSDAAIAQWHFVSSVKTESYSVVAEKAKSLKVLPGAGNRSLLEV